jgi:large subunit ribosomal protein L21
MYAVIKTGGKQYKVAKDQILVVEKLPAEAGETLSFDEVLMVGEGDQATVGTPFVAGAAVNAEVVEQSRAGKIIIFKKKRRKGYRRRKGHRQEQTVLRVTEVLTDGKKPAKAKAKAEPAPKDEAAAPKKAAPKETAEKKPAEKKAAEKKAAEKKPAAKKPAAKATTAKAKKPAAKKPAAKKDAGQAAKTDEE